MLAHTTYLRPIDFSLDAGEPVEILVFNGTFDESVQSVVVETTSKFLRSSPSGTYQVDKGTWQPREAGSSAWRNWNKLKTRLGGLDRRRTSTITLSLDEQGTHVVGVQFHPGRIAMDLPKFNEYLVEVGLQDESISQFKSNEADAIIREQWTKTAKTILDVGEGAGETALQPLGLVAEIVPMTHPRDLRAGDTLKVKLLIFGQPLPNQVVLAGREQGFAGKGRGDHVSVRSDADGIARILITHDGEWWIGYNRMLQAKPGQEVDLVTYWTTITFEIN